MANTTVIRIRRGPESGLPEASTHSFEPLFVEESGNLYITSSSRKPVLINRFRTITLTQQEWEHLVDNPELADPNVLYIIPPQGTPESYGLPPESTEPDITTTVIGSRDAVLGRPVTYAKFGDYLIPLYKEASEG